MLTLEGVQLRNGAFNLTASWGISAGEKVAIIGPSGSGKSTLLLAIAGFLTPSAGRICWADQDLSDVPPGQRPMTILFQDHNLFPHLTAAQNIALGLPKGQSVADVLIQVGLEGLDTRKPDQLSGGQQGRVALARALVRARPILLLDEPFAALGPALKSEMLELLGQVAAQTGAMVLMVTHDPNDAKMLADKTVFVDSGIAHPPAPTAALFDNPPPALRSYLG